MLTVLTLQKHKSVQIKLIRIHFQGKNKLYSDRDHILELQGREIVCVLACFCFQKCPVIGCLSDNLEAVVYVKSQSGSAQTAGNMKPNVSA